MRLRSTTTIITVSRSVILFQAEIRTNGDIQNDFQIILFTCCFEYKHFIQHFDNIWNDVYIVLPTKEILLFSNKELFENGSGKLLLLQKENQQSEDVRYN